jgi:hypothetical protein
MEIIQFGPPESRGIDLDCDIRFKLNKPEVDTLSSPVTQGVIAALLAPGVPPFGAIAAVMILNYINVMKDHAGQNGVEVKCTIRQGAGLVTMMKEFIAEPIN